MIKPYLKFIFLIVNIRFIDIIIIIINVCVIHKIYYTCYTWNGFDFFNVYTP